MVGEEVRARRVLALPQPLPPCSQELQSNTPDDMEGNIEKIEARIRELAGL